MERSAIWLRVTTFAAAAFFGALVWFAVSVVFAAPAHAQDDDPVGDLLTSITEPVSGLVEPLASTVKSTLEPVTAAVQPIVTSVGSVAAPVLTPVGDAAAPVVTAVTGTVGAVTDAAAPVLAPVTRAIEPVTAPVVDALTPVTDLVTSVPGVDAIVTPVIDTVTEVVAPEATTPGVALPPALDASTDSSAGAQPALDLVVAATVATEAARPVAAALTSFRALLATTIPAGAPAAVVMDAAGGPLAPAGGLWRLSYGDPSASFTPSMNAFGLGAALALGSLVLTHRAWAWRRAPRNESAPLAPAFPPDASPD